MAHHKNRLAETVLMRSHNICFKRVIRKIISELSNTSSYLELCKSNTYVSHSACCRQDKTVAKRNCIAMQLEELDKPFLGQILTPWHTDEDMTGRRGDHRNTVSCPQRGILHSNSHTLSSVPSLHIPVHSTPQQF